MQKIFMAADEQPQQPHVRRFPKFRFSNLSLTARLPLPIDPSNVQFIFLLLVHPKAIACGADLSFTPDVFFIIYFFSPLVKSPRCVGQPAWNFARWSVIGPIL